ncbi:MAG: hypothetical protein V3V11_09130 [Vicinamibacteria bacterium]
MNRIPLGGQHDDDLVLRHESEEPSHNRDGLQHGNDPRDDSIIVSERHQDAVVKFSRSTGIGSTTLTRTRARHKLPQQVGGEKCGLEGKRLNAKRREPLR